MIVLCTIGRVNIASDVIYFFIKKIELMWDKRNWSKWGIFCCSWRGDNNIRLSGTFPVCRLASRHGKFSAHLHVTFLQPNFFGASSKPELLYWNWKKSPHGVFIRIKTFQLHTVSLQAMRSTSHAWFYKAWCSAVIRCFFNSSDWCISILAVHSVICSLGGPLSHGSPVVVFFDRGHPRYWNFYSTIPVDFDVVITNR